MRIVFLLLMVIAAPAHAQLTKCIDERGRVHYTDKPIPGCKPTAAQPTPLPQPPAAKKKEAPKPLAKAPPKAKPEPPPSISECKAAQEQKDWLLSDRGRGVEMRTTRLAQIEQMLRKCR